MTLAGALTLNLGWLLIFTTALRLVEWLRGWQEVRFTVVAWFGLFAYVAIHIILELYRAFSGIEIQILVWQLSLVATIGMYALLWSVMSGRPMIRKPLVWVAAIVSLFTLMVPMENVVNQKLAEFSLSLFILVLCFECLLAINPKDTMAKTIWQVLLIANLMTSAQILDCQLLHNIAAARIEGSSCGQLYGWTVSWMPFLITTGGLALIICGHRNQD